MTARGIAVMLALALLASHNTVEVPRAWLRDQLATVATVKYVPAPASRAAKRLTDSRAEPRRPSARPPAAPPPQSDLPTPYGLHILLTARNTCAPRTARPAHLAECRAPPRNAA